MLTVDPGLVCAEARQRDTHMQPQAQGASSSHVGAVSIHDELICKIAVIGDTRVGKTAILQALTRSAWNSAPDVNGNSDGEGFSPREGEGTPLTLPSSAGGPAAASSPKRTIGIDFSSRVIKEVTPLLDMRLQFWDTAGDPVFAPDMEAVLKHAGVVVVVFDTTQPSSFRSIIDNYIPLIQSLRPQLPEECILVVENKIDERHRMDAEKMKMTPAMRRLKEAAAKNAAAIPGDSIARSVDEAATELVDLRAAQAEVFELVPSASYVDMSVMIPEKTQFLLSGIVDLVLGQWEEKQLKLPESAVTPTLGRNMNGVTVDQVVLDRPRESNDGEEEESPPVMNTKQNDNLKRKETPLDRLKRAKDEAHATTGREDDDDFSDSGANSSVPPTFNPSAAKRPTSNESKKIKSKIRKNFDDDDTSNDSDDDKKAKKNKKKGSKKKGDGCGCGSKEGCCTVM
jgi:GTPase SAR1 family protein